MIVHGVNVIPDYPEPGTTFVSNETAQRECGCRILLGVKVDDAARLGERKPEFATVAAPCRPDHARVVNAATERLRERIEDPALEGKQVIETADECLAAVEVEP